MEEKGEWLTYSNSSQSNNASCTQSQFLKKCTYIRIGGSN